MCFPLVETWSIVVIEQLLVRAIAGGNLAAVAVPDPIYEAWTENGIPRRSPHVDSNSGPILFDAS